MTVNEFYPTWIKWKKPRVKKSTLSAYLLIWKSHVQTFWGEKEIETIRSRDFQDYLDSKLSEGSLCVKTIHDQFVMIKNLYFYACDYLEINPIRIKLTYPSMTLQGERRPKTLDNKAVNALIEYIKANPSYRNIGIALTLTTGIRIGELCSLKFEDIDFENKRIHICKTVSRVYDVDTKKTEVIITPAKSVTSNRYVPLTGFCEKWLKAANKICLPDYYLLSGTRALVEPRIYRNHFNEVLNKAGIPHINFHALRHTFATRLIASKVDVKTVSEILGHHDPSITLAVYTHTDDNTKRNSVLKAFKDL